MYNCGLVVGKFSPLHKGHVFLIKEAQRHCKELIIISYSKPEYEGCCKNHRKTWLKSLFPTAHIFAFNRCPITGGPLPDNEAPEHDHRNLCGWVCEHMAKLKPNAVFTSEPYGEGFSQFLSQQYGSLVKHIEVDRERVKVPISATQIRQNIHAHREWLPPEVYKNFVEKVVFLGAESTGKSTMVQLISKQMNTTPVPEYGRTLWEEKQGHLEYTDMLRIGKKQLQIEEEMLSKANQFLICDTSPLTTCFYSEVLFGKVDPALYELGKIKYNHIFLCQPDFPLVQDGTRQDEAFRKRQHEWYLKTLAEREWPYKILSGPPPLRQSEVIKTLSHA